MEQQQKEKLTPIVNTAKPYKKPLMKKITEAFISVDFKDAVKETNQKFILPILKKTVVDIVSNGVNNTLNTMLFGQGSNVNRPSWFGNNGLFGQVTNYAAPMINYSGISSGKPATSLPAATGIPTYDEIVLQSREDAERVLDTLQAQIDRFGSTTISDLYELVGFPTVSTYYNYGWKSLAGANIGIVTGGYLLKMPTAIPLK